ncbi:MAG: hypothetical protein RLW62_09185 [Gammaproteobacteria bacterium]
MKLDRTAILGATLAALSATGAHASVFGTLSNFDVFNNSPTDYYGFVIELEDISLSNIPSYNGRYYTYTNWHYGAGEVSAYSDGSTTGVRVTYRKPGDANAVTPVYDGAILPTNGHSCISLLGCEHFGVAVNGGASATRYYWLDAAGNRTEQVDLLAPSWNVVRPAVPAQNGQPAQAAVVQVEIEAPEVDPGRQRSDAIWVQVFKRELEDAVDLDDLMADQDVVPDGEQGQTEIEWKLFQRDPSKPDKNLLGNGDGEEIGEAADQVLRTYRFFKFAGTYDPENHEAWCSLGEADCEDLVEMDANGDGEPDHLRYVGAPIGQQMAALNLDGAIPAPVPVPPALPLLLSATAGLLLNNRRRRLSAA